jgi:hypothetical protein
MSRQFPSAIAISPAGLAVRAAPERYRNPRCCMSDSSPPVVPHLRIAADTARICPFKEFARGRRAIDTQAPPHSALTSAAESLHGDKFRVLRDFMRDVRGCALQV